MASQISLRGFLFYWHKIKIIYAKTANYLYCAYYVNMVYKTCKICTNKYKTHALYRLIA